MLTALKLGNFKAFAETQNIPIRPLTLIFGANSAGKSSILHGILYGAHVAKTGQLDANKIVHPQGEIDLGGFQQFIHQRDLSQPVKLGFAFDLAAMTNEKAEPLFSAKRIGMQIDILKSRLHDRCVVGDLEFSANDSWLFKMFNPSGSHRIREFNFENPIIGEWVLKGTERMSGVNLTESNSGAIFRELEDWCCEYRAYVDGLVPRAMSLFDDAMIAGVRTWPNFAPLLNWTKQSEKFLEPPWGKLSRVRIKINPKRQNKELAEMAKFLMLRLVEHLFETIHRLISTHVGKVEYIGPLRPIPPRQVLCTSLNELDFPMLHAIATKDPLRKKVNKWLGDKSKMATPYELVSRIYERSRKGSRTMHGFSDKNEESAIRELLLIDRRTTTVVSAHDVGMGVSQILPILVATLGSDYKIHAIEQPEIHVHPALQAELGDVFIESALGEQKNTFILETHSEHLLLRIMRRMRETCSGKLPKGIRAVRPDDVALFYVQPDGSRSIVREMPLNERGELQKQWPGGFFEEGLKEVLPSYDR